MHNNVSKQWSVSTQCMRKQTENAFVSSSTTDTVRAYTRLQIPTDIRF